MTREPMLIHIVVMRSDGARTSFEVCRRVSQVDDAAIWQTLERERFYLLEAAMARARALNEQWTEPEVAVSPPQIVSLDDNRAA